MTAAQFVIGIDGGGSTVRAALVRPDLRVQAEYTGPAVNPSVVGRDEAAARIRATLANLLHQAQIAPEQIAGVGLGIAGASNRYDWAADWLRGIVAGVLPAAPVWPSSDYEIALVGAQGERRGVLLLAGTGSLAYGINAAGESALVGGWGYLVGDEGSGYWLGAQALRAVVRMADERGPRTRLTAALLPALQLRQPLDLIPWLYASGPRVQDIARLAPLVLDCAEQGDPAASQIVETGARELVLAVRAVQHRLDLHAAAPMFAGSLLSAPNPLSQRVCALLNLTAIPTPRYPPVIGAALLALNPLAGKKD
jgi:N-acetylglucosamine kinase-like BadF-type ATPase